MNTEESSDLETESNNLTMNESKAPRFDNNNLADYIGKTLLKGEEREEPPVSENAEADTAISEDDSVHSQSEQETEQTQNKDSEETEETKSEDEEFERGLPKGVKKRIDKLSAKRREAEAEVDRLKSEVERLSQEAVKPAQSPTKANPYSNLSTIEEVSREIDQAKQIRRWCELNPDGAVVTNKDGTEAEYSAEDVRNIKIKALDAMEEHLPARAKYLQDFNQIEQIATKEYPWWKDKSARERQMAETFLKHFPEVQKFPDYKMVIGDYIRGIKARESTQARNKTVSQKAPLQPKPSASPQRLSPKEANDRTAQQRFQVTGNRDDLSSIIANRFL